MNRIAIIGGGITGLSLAWHLSHQSGIDVRLFEARPHFGGNIRTVDFAGRRLEMGPDSFLNSAGDLMTLIDGVGLSYQLTSPAMSDTQVFVRGRLRKLPVGVMSGSMSSARSLVRAGIVSPLGLVRAGVDLVKPRNRFGSDATVGEIVRNRFGNELFENVVEPLVGGIRSGSCDTLSARRAQPDLAAAAQHRSVLLGLRAQRKKSSTRPRLVGLPLGMDQLVVRLTDAARGKGAQLFTDSHVESLSRLEDGWQVMLDPVSKWTADEIVITTPPAEAARLLSHEAPESARLVGSLPAADLAMVALAYPSSSLKDPFRHSGCLLPADGRRLLTACSYMSTKWSHLAGDPLILRASAGRAGDTRLNNMEDGALVERLISELQDLLPLQGRPSEVLVNRWPAGSPQPTPAALQSVASARALLPDGLHLLGSPYDGTGLAACASASKSFAEHRLTKRNSPTGR